MQDKSQAVNEDKFNRQSILSNSYRTYGNSDCVGAGIQMTQETYQHLTEVHGINQWVCKKCWERPVEVYQDNFEGCYKCWCRLCEPVIKYPEEYEE